MKKAWEDEPLTKVLGQDVISLLYPGSSEDTKYTTCARINGRLVGQCFTHKNVANYWKGIDTLNSNLLTPNQFVFASIHSKAIREERDYYSSLKDVKLEKSYHCAGIVVDNQHRGHQLGKRMRIFQIKNMIECGANILFCETTNCHSAKTVSGLGFIRIASWSYDSLGKEFNCPEIQKIDDYFNVWCLQPQDVDIERLSNELTLEIALYNRTKETMKKIDEKPSLADIKEYLTSIVHPVIQLTDKDINYKMTLIVSVLLKMIENQEEQLELAEEWKTAARNQMNHYHSILLKRIESLERVMKN